MQQADTTKRDKFTVLTQGIRELIAHDKLAKVEEIVSKFERSDESETRKLLLRAVVRYLRMEYPEALDLLSQARHKMSPEDYPEDSSIFSAAMVHSQLSLPRRSRSATSLGYNFYRKNISALRQVDPELAEQVQRSSWPQGYQLIEYWGGLHLYYSETKTLLALADGMKEQLREHLQKRGPITFAGLGTGQELRYCLDRQVDILYGMTRTHYLFEPDVQNIKAGLHLFDMSRFLPTQELLLFGGRGLAKRRDEIFRTRRYPNPNLIIGSPEPLEEHVRVINGYMNDEEIIQRVQDYYNGTEYLDRLRKIAAGQIQPRILVSTCRWTTFLKHCASDFERAFAQAGCQTRLIIEENDVQTLSAALDWCEWETFRPDVVFMVSHARPSSPYAPKTLPFIAYIQDKCGPVLWHPTLEDHIAPQDMFVCSVGEFQKYIIAKQVPEYQTFVMPVPTDDREFYPLEEDHTLAAEFACDLAYVKHGNADREIAMRQWLQSKQLLGSTDPLAQRVANVFGDMYQQFLQEPERLWYEDDMQAYVREKLHGRIQPEQWPNIQQLATTFSVQVYPACRRYYYLQALAEEGIAMRLYGNEWDQDPQFARFDAGPVERGPTLNAVYRFSRINLHLHPYATMHQRLSECGLSGGFMMVADHAPQKDWESARNYFDEDREIVFFRTAEELVERSRYFLAHPEERLTIARNMYQRAVRERTCNAGAETVLEKWRNVLTRTLAK